MSKPWSHLPSVRTDHFADTRLQSHWAAQIVASLGYTFVEPEPDWSHVSLSLMDGRLRSRQATILDFSASLDVGRMAIALHDRAFQVVDEFKLDGETLDDGYAWLQTAISRLRPGEDLELIRPDHELPDHVVASGAVFDTQREIYFATLAAWFRNTALAVQTVIDSEKGASSIRCWPHHFDMASLITLDPGPDAENARSIGLGMSPGDSAYDQPYYYVTPWPYPETHILPPLNSSGVWHTEGWVGAILTCQDIASSQNQETMVSGFLDQAVATCRELLDR